MKTSITALATAVFAAALVWIYRDATRPAPVVAPAPVQAPVVQMPAPLKTTVEINGELEGRLEAASEVEIRTPLVGYPVRLKASAGDFVQKGQLLVDFGDTKLEESVTRAEAALNVVKADFQARDTRLAQATKEETSPMAAAGAPATATLHRAAQPAKQGPSPEEQLDRSRLQQAEASVAKAKQALTEMRIVAPIAGYVIQRQADGELSKPDAVLMRIVDITSVKTTIQLSRELYSKVIPDQEVRVALNEIPGRSFPGKVVRKAPGGKVRASDTAVSVEVANPENLLKPGMYAHVRPIFDQNNEPRLAALSLKGGPAGSGGAGPQSDAELLSNLKGLTQTMSTMASELEHREQAAKTTAEASRVHFLAMERLIVRLREETSSTGAHRLSFEKTADAIDTLPTLHVDEELMAFSTDVSKALREMAERRREIARETSSIDWTYWDRTQRASGAVKSQGMQRINSALTEMRRKLTRKYNLEFLTTAERAPSRRESHRARR